MLFRSNYEFPQHITNTTLRPDIVWWSTQERPMCLLEFTISYETAMDEAHTRKMAKYKNIVQSAREVGVEVECIALEVGSRGLTRDDELAQLQTALGASTKAVNELTSVLSHTTILNSGVHVII